MISLDEARQRVLAGCPAADAVEASLDDALGRVLAEDVVAGEDVPPFASSAMDGYAVHAEDLAGAGDDAPRRLRIVGTIAAGQAPTAPVGRGEAVRIMTGAPFPPGADAVAIVETTRSDGDAVEVLAAVAPGDHVRPAGEDLAAGQPVFTAGTVLGAGHLGVLASVGRERVRVVPAPVVGVLSTGDELVAGGGPLGPGQIRDSNRRTLLGLLRRDGYPVVDLGIARDDEDEIRDRIGEAARRCDAVLTSGGVSMGAFDYVRKVLEDVAEMAWMQVAIRPAKPFAFGTLPGPDGSDRRVPVFGLPGNPVSSMVSYEVLARPGLRRLAGHGDADLVRPARLARAGDDLPRGAAGRTTFVRVVCAEATDGRLEARSAGGQASNLLYPMALANGLAVVGPGEAVTAGADVPVLVTGS